MTPYFPKTLCSCSGCFLPGDLDKEGTEHGSNTPHTPQIDRCRRGRKLSWSGGPSNTDPCRPPHGSWPLDLLRTGIQDGGYIADRDRPNRGLGRAQFSVEKPRPVVENNLRKNPASKCVCSLRACNSNATKTRPFHFFCTKPSTEKRSLVFSYRGSFSSYGGGWLNE